MNKPKKIALLQRMRISPPNPEIPFEKMTNPQLEELISQSVDIMSAANEQLARKDQARKNKANNAGKANVNATRWESLLSAELSKNSQRYTIDRDGQRIFCIVTADELIQAGFTESQTKKHTNDMLPSFSVGAHAIERGFVCFPMKENTWEKRARDLDAFGAFENDMENEHFEAEIAWNHMRMAVNDLTGREEIGKTKKGEPVYDSRFVVYALDPDLILAYTWTRNRNYRAELESFLSSTKFESIGQDPDSLLESYDNYMADLATTRSEAVKNSDVDRIRQIDELIAKGNSIVSHTKRWRLQERQFGSTFGSQTAREALAKARERGYFKGSDIRPEIPCSPAWRLEYGPEFRKGCLFSNDEEKAVNEAMNWNQTIDTI